MAVRSVSFLWLLECGACGPVVLTRVCGAYSFALSHPRDIWQYLEMLLVSQLGKELQASVYRDKSSCSTPHRARDVPTTKKCEALQGSNAKGNPGFSLPHSTPIPVVQNPTLQMASGDTTT